MLTVFYFFFFSGGEAAPHVPTRLVFSRVRVVTALTLDSVEKD